MKKTVTLAFSAVELVVVVICDRPGDAGGWGLSAGVWLWLPLVLVVCWTPQRSGSHKKFLTTAQLTSTGTACVTETRPARSPRKRERRLKIIIWGSIYTKHYCTCFLQVIDVWYFEGELASSIPRSFGSWWFEEKRGSGSMISTVTILLSYPSSGAASAVSVPYSPACPVSPGITYGVKQNRSPYVLMLPRIDRVSCCFM
ncbi:uncharacterized protein C8R40DRAFT_745964 [Lentinula edodes]|uniref:uncharacterized protein n=1 Tax=Lentinula edodes TaxID=5353 RepID=UPI001E8EB046|nr:uncharacterized protein C8R40DRAFT_745964 [Lentinula edodes]KAH7869331.1 hypothetical protein C8R40DRAFT_745964 [Lentinula edodes]